MQALLQDVRYGARMLIKKPGFAIVAVATLALGIGANTAIFSVVNAVLLRPLPYHEAQQLVAIYTSISSPGNSREALSESEFIRLRQAKQSFADLAGWNSDRATLRGISEPERVIAPFCTANLFRMLGVKMALGRDFTDDEELTGRNNVAVLSHSFWQRKFALDPAIIGRQLTLDGGTITVIGVLPASFKAPMELQADTRVDLWHPFDFQPSNPRSRADFKSVMAIGQLRPEVTLAQANTEHRANVQRESSEHPQGEPQTAVGIVVPLQRAVAGDSRQAILTLFAAVVVVLLIACVNVANLLLVRGEDRRKEIAVRAALGASRGRIIRQLLIESLLLGVLGGALGSLLAIWGVEALLAISPDNIPRLAESSLDLRVTSFALLVSLLTAFVFGLTPALHIVRFDLHTTLKEGGRTAGQGGRNRLRQSLVAVEMAMAMVLLVAAGLLIRSAWNLQNVEVGFRSDHLLTMRLTPGSGYGDNQKITSLYDGVLARITSLPGVQSAAVTDPLPINGGGRETEIEIEGRPRDVDRLKQLSADFRTVSADYFKAMGMRLTRGRLFTQADQEGAMPAVVINETFARNQWPGEDPVGRRFRSLDTTPGRPGPRFVTVIGVVADARNRAIAEVASPEAFVPLTQHAASYGGGGDGLQQAFNLVVRTTVDPSSVAAAVQREAREVETGFIISQVRPMDEIMATAVVQPRFNMILLSIFALLALGLAAVGIYGVISYTVAQRNHEIGIRMALGAQTRDVVRMLLKQGMALTLLGVSVGLVIALALTRLMKTLLYGVSETDPLTFIAIATLLSSIALLACWIPARRAAKVNPLIALRGE